MLPGMSRFRPLDRIDSLIIHCSASPGGRPDTAADIDAWHKRNRWRRAQPQPGGSSTLHHIGYHYVIERSGRVVVGRALTETGAHAGPAWNGRSVGICLVGWDQFTHRQWEALAGGVRKLRRELPAGDALRIFGHRDAPANKICPGFEVADWLRDELRPLPGHVADV